MRRTILLLLILWPALTGTLLAIGHPPSGAVLEPRSFQQMAGEDRLYSLDFLVFRNLAEGRLRLTAEPVPGRYRAELVARTLGVASWLTGDRTQRYVSVMEEDGSGRLRSISHESAILKRRAGTWKDRRKHYRFDYRVGKVYQEKGENGTFSPGAVFELPPDRNPVDILTGFYNLRAGIYGALVPGALIKIPTFTTKGIAEIEVEVLSASTRPNFQDFPANGTLLRVRVDPEIFDTDGSDMYVWFDETGRPARGIVENVIGLGNVYGHVAEEDQSP
jgi:hypothetical protein